MEQICKTKNRPPWMPCHVCLTKRRFELLRRELLGASLPVELTCADSPRRVVTANTEGLLLGCVSCHSSAEVFFLLNFFVVEGGCEVFGLQNLADLYVGFAVVGVGASL